MLPYNIFPPDAKFNEQSKLHVKSLNTNTGASRMLAVVWTGRGRWVLVVVVVGGGGGDWWGVVSSD